MTLRRFRSAVPSVPASGDPARMHGGFANDLRCLKSCRKTSFEYFQGRRIKRPARPFGLAAACVVFRLSQVRGIETTTLVAIHIGREQ